MLHEHVSPSPSSCHHQFDEYSFSELTHATLHARINSQMFRTVGVDERFSFSNLRDLWKEAASKYIPVPSFGNIMSCKKFKAIIMNIYFSDTSKRTDEPLTDTEFSLVSSFLKATNEHGQHYVKPSDHICVDESISRWYGPGGDWIKMGFPRYVDYDFKSQN